MKRAFDNSLREFPLHLAERRELDDVIAIFGNVAFARRRPINWRELPVVMDSSKSVEIKPISQDEMRMSEARQNEP